jgi:Plasmid replication region DNA-binding N-term
MRQEIITYDLFCETAQKMVQHNERITVRTLHSHIGGSFAKLGDFLKRWRNEQAYAQSQADKEISSNLKQAILAEMGKAVAEVKSRLEVQLAQSGEQLDEANEVIAKQENDLEGYQQQLHEWQQKSVILEALNKQQLQKIQALENKLEQSIQQRHETDKKAVVAETKCLELEKLLTRYEKQAAFELENNPSRKKALPRKTTLSA